MEKWPNFFIVGAPRAGTTSLYEYLKVHPLIFMSPIKEPNYFSRKTVPADYHYMKLITRNNERYLKLFKNSKNEKFIGEATTHYLADPDAPYLIHKKSPNGRIIISLRDPVERMFSHYLMVLNRNIVSLSFHDQLELEFKDRSGKQDPGLRLDSGMYSESVNRYLEVFGKKNVKILIFEEWTVNIKNTINEILKFLELSQIINYFENKSHNKNTVTKVARGTLAKHLLQSKTANKIAKSLLTTSTRNFLRVKMFSKQVNNLLMDEKDRITLKEFYEKDVKKLENILGRKLPWANFTKISYLNN